MKSNKVNFDVIILMIDILESMFRNFQDFSRFLSRKRRQFDCLIFFVKISAKWNVTWMTTNFHDFFCQSVFVIFRNPKCLCSRYLLILLPPDLLLSALPRFSWMTSFRKRVAYLWFSVPLKILLKIGSFRSKISFGLRCSENWTDWEFLGCCWFHWRCPTITATWAMPTPNES